MTNRSRPMSGLRRWLARVGVIAAALLLLLGAWVLLTGVEPMPATIWLQGDETAMERDRAAEEIHVGAWDGPAFGEARQASAWDAGWSPSNGEGISFRRALSNSEYVKYRLAGIGILPRDRVYGAGYESTGATVERDGATWREFRKFSDDFNYTQVGWWRW